MWCRRMANERLPWSAALLCLLFATACATAPGRLVVNADLIAAAQRGDALATSDALEALIERGADAPGGSGVRVRNRVQAGDRHRRGRLRARGRHGPPRATARAARREPDRRGRNLCAAQPGARSRLPRRRGDAPARHALRDRARRPARARRLRAGHRAARGARGASIPEVVENQLRLAEAYIALGDPDPAGLPLCICLNAPESSSGATTNSSSTSWWRRPARRTATSRLSAQRAGAFASASGRSRERIQSAAGSAVKSAIIESTKASAASVPN